EGDVRTWTPLDAPDLIYSNATLHWVEDHPRLFPRLLAFLKPGGCLAVQMPLSRDSPSHRLMRETLANGGENGMAVGGPEQRRGGERRREAGNRWALERETYYELLRARTAQLDIWTTEYLHVLEGENPVLEWVKGTGLRPIIDGLDGAERERFVSEYSRRLRGA